MDDLMKNQIPFGNRGEAEVKDGEKQVDNTLRAAMETGKTEKR